MFCCGSKSGEFMGLVSIRKVLRIRGVLTPIRKVWLGAGPRMIVSGFLVDRVVVLAWVEAGLVGVVISWVLSWFKGGLDRLWFG